MSFKLTTAYYEVISKANL